MIRVSNIRLDIRGDEEAAMAAALKALRLGKEDVAGIRVARMSVDARDKAAIRMVYAVDVSLKGDEAAFLRRRPVKDAQLVQAEERLRIPTGDARRRPVVVGLGPCGLFAALYLARAGMAPLVLERGQPVRDRARAVNRLFQKGELNPESNIQFGEGGAGAFSDGKLTSRIRSPLTREVLHILHEFGAPDSVLYLQRPHLGTDRLPRIVGAIRGEIERLGGQVLFEAKLSGLDVKDGRLRGIRYEKDGQTHEAACAGLILALGHSARDSQRMLYDAGLQMRQKPISIGFRIEQKQAVIDRAQYGERAGQGLLPPAEYHLSHRSAGGRGVYSFCMCPGGLVVNASSEPGGLCVNGMSPYRRNFENANAAILVDVRPQDYGGEDPLMGFRFQRRWEEAAFLLGGGGYRAPAQLAEDFIRGRESTGLGDVRPSLRPGITLCDLRQAMPAWAADSLREGLLSFDRKLKGFLQDAVLTGVETRSSSPLQAVRREDGQGSIQGVYPAGEGAGMAGGIMSSAVEGLVAAMRLAGH